MAGAANLLCAMLDCGECDLELLDRVGYDWDEILEQMDYPDASGLSFHGILRAVVDLGIIEIKDALSDRILELESEQIEEELSKEELDELRSLCLLNPDVDIQAWYNYRDTHIWFAQNGSIYWEYLGGAVAEFEENVGFYLTGD